MNKQPQPVLLAPIGALVTALLGVLVAFNVPVTHDQQSSILALVSVLVVIAGYIGAWWAKRKVTPVESPRDDDGEELVRADGEPLVAERVPDEGPLRP